MTEAWSLPEVELVVADYFAMLWKELAGLPIDKTAHRKALKPRLNGRSHGSIEFKHFVQRDARNRDLGRNGESAPRMYPLMGALDQVCQLEPQSFVARVG